jgi:hypothetical protein
MNVVNTNSLVLQQIQDMLKKEIGDSASEQALLTSTLRYLSKWRSVLIQNTFIKHQGTEVMQGPFAGMDFLPHSAEGCHIDLLPTSRTKVMEQSPLISENSGYETIQIYR